MGKTKIEWADYSFNTHMGCAKVSPGCANCYAETFDKRFKAGANWGIHNGRQFMSDKYWKKLRSWNDLAKKQGQKFRVFCNSHSDLFERHQNRDVNREIVRNRWSLFSEILVCDHLIFLLLTKRIENVKEMVPMNWMANGFPENVMILTSVENQEMADLRIPKLLKIPARYRGLSVEPLLGSVDLSPYLGKALLSENLDLHSLGDVKRGGVYFDHPSQIDWVIVGGESGPKARKMAPGAVRVIRDQCVHRNVPFFFKQWGKFIHMKHWRIEMGAGRADGEYWALGKKKTGRLLDGVTHDAHPFDLEIRE